MVVPLRQYGVRQFEKSMKRIGLSGIYFTEKFPGEDKMEKTAIEDCSEARREYILSTLKSSKIRQIFDGLLDTMKILINYMQTKGLINELTAERLKLTSEVYIQMYKTPRVDKRIPAIQLLCKRIKELEEITSNILQYKKQ